MLAQFKKFEISKSQQQAVQGGLTYIDLFRPIMTSGGETMNTPGLPQMMNNYNTLITLQQEMLNKMNEANKNVAQKVG